MGTRVEEVQLGKNTYQVVAQRHAYLERKLGPYSQEVAQLAAGDVSGLVKAGSEGYHGLLAIFIPDLMPLWEWRGFASQKAYDETELWKKTGGAEGSDQYDEKADNSPDLDQMVTAFTAVAHVNRIDLVAKLKELVGPDFFDSKLWRAIRARGEVEALRVILPSTGGSGSESLPPASGERPPENGGTTPPTSAPSAAGPTPE